MRPPGPAVVPLAGDEDRHSRLDWERAAAAVLRRAGRLGPDDPDSLVWGRLAAATLDGVVLPPLGTPDAVAGVPDPGRPARAPYVRGTPNRTAGQPWDVRVLVSLGGRTLAEARQAALEDLANGASSLWLRLLGDAPTAAEFDDLLTGVDAAAVPLALDAPSDPVGAATGLVRWWARQRAQPAAGSTLGADPLGQAAREALTTENHPDAARIETAAGARVTEVARLATAAVCGGFVVDGTVVHDAGGSDGQEVGYTLAVGAAYLRMLTGAGLAVGEALGLVEFRYAVTDEQLPMIAKLRAARRGWARVAELSGASPAAGGQRQHAVTSRPMMSRYDPWVNMLRTTVAAFAAGVGGATAVTVLPFDPPLGIPEALGRRIARNTSSVLLAESHLDLVADPAGGAYAVERLTDDLAQVAWTELGRIEAAGGVAAALADGSLAARIDETATRRDEEVACRRRPLTGLSEFPDVAEIPLARRPDPAAPVVRAYGAAYEAMRDDHLDSAVFLATLGPIAEHHTRAGFVRNLLAAGGVPVTPAGPIGGVEDLVAAYDGSPVVCLAGSDAAYAAWGGDAVAALRSAGARHLILAGKPDESTVPADLLDDSCVPGGDAVAFLRRTRRAVRGAGTPNRGPS